MAREKISQAEEVLDKAKLYIKDKLGLFDPVIIYPFRGYGNEHTACLTGRILEREHVIHGREEIENESIWQNIRKVWKRYESDEVPGVTITGELYGYEAETVSDNDGYFTLEFTGLGERRLEDGWHQVALQIKEMPFDIAYEEKATGEVLINNQEDSFGIISDVDDTIIESNATNAIKRISTLIRHTAETRTAFEGVDELYHGLIQDFKNPLFFVSGSSYNLYDLLIDFCEHHHIPKAPFLLRDLGLSPGQWIKQDTIPYKLAHIRTLMQMYPKMKFICIGDSGQQDAEVYQQIHQEFPGRIHAIYLRKVGSGAIEKRIQTVEDELDIPFLLMEHSRAAIDHARDNGWIK